MALTILPGGATAMSLSLVSLSGLVLGVKTSTLRWSYTQLDGWHGAPPARDRIEDRPDGDGGYDAPPFLSPRTITIGGRVRGARADVARALDTLAAAAVGTPCVIGVDDPDLGYRTVTARLSGTPIVDAASLGVGVARWSLSFRAADARKYATPVSATVGLRTPDSGGLTYVLTYPLTYGTAGSGGIVAIVNTGTAPSEPTLTVNGPLTAGFEITHVETGRRLRYAATVGGPLILDCRTGSCTTEGQDRGGNLTIREWFTVPAGATGTFAWTSLGAETYLDPATLTVALAPAFN